METPYSIVVAIQDELVGDWPEVNSWPVGIGPHHTHGGNDAPDCTTCGQTPLSKQEALEAFQYLSGCAAEFFAFRERRLKNANST